MRLQTKFLTIFILILLFVMGADIAIFQQETERAIRDRTYDQLESVSAALQLQLTQTLTRQQSDVESIAAWEDIRTYMLTFHDTNASVPTPADFEKEQGELASEAKLLDRFSQEQERESYYEISVITREGIIDFSTDKSREDRRAIFEDYFIFGQNRTYVNPFYYDAEAGHVANIVATPIRRPDGTMIGVLLVKINSSTIDALTTERSGLGTSGESLFVNKQGLLVSDARFAPGQQYRKEINTEGSRACVQGTSGNMAYPDYWGVPVFAHYTWIQSRDLCVISKIDQSEALLPVVKTLSNYLPIGIGIVLFGIMVAFAFSRRLAKPLEQIEQGTRQLRAGNYEVIIPTRTRQTNDDIDLLARSFNSMAIDLKRAHESVTQQDAQLKRLVDERTRELELKVSEIEKTKNAMLNILEDTDLANRELTNAKVELAKHIEQLQALDQKKDEFISIASHELKTPLASIQGFTELLINPKVMANPAMRDKYLEIIRSDTRRLGDLITNILDLSKLDLGRIKLTSDKVDVAQFVQDLRQEILPLLSKKKLTLALAIDARLPPMTTDKSRLSQIITNLLTNAIKYSNDGGIIELKAWQGSEKPSGLIHISVRDTGVGMDAQTLSRLFERFYQAESAYTRKVGGTGLGLAISRELARLMGGNIGVTSKIGKGSTFEVTLPIVLVVRESNFPESQSPGQQDAKEQGAHAPPGAGQKSAVASSPAASASARSATSALLRQAGQAAPGGAPSTTGSASLSPEQTSKIQTIINEAYDILGPYAVSLAHKVPSIRVDNRGRIISVSGGSAEDNLHLLLTIYRDVLGPGFLDEARE